MRCAGYRAPIVPLAPASPLCSHHLLTIEFCDGHSLLPCDEGLCVVYPSLVPLVVDDALVRQPLPELPLLCVCVITENQFYSYCWIGLQVSNETKPGTRSTPPPHDPPVWAVGGFQQLNGLFNTSKSRAARARPPLAGAGINYQQFNGLKKFNKSSGTIEPICRLSIRHQSFFLWQV